MTAILSGPQIVLLRTLLAAPLPLAEVYRDPAWRSSVGPLIEAGFARPAGATAEIPRKHIIITPRGREALDAEEARRCGTQLE